MYDLKFKDSIFVINNQQQIYLETAAFLKSQGVPEENILMTPYVNLEGTKDVSVAARLEKNDCAVKYEKTTFWPELLPDTPVKWTEAVEEVIDNTEEQYDELVHDGGTCNYQRCGTYAQYTEELLSKLPGKITGLEPQEYVTKDVPISTAKNVYLIGVQSVPFHEHAPIIDVKKESSELDEISDSLYITTTPLNYVHEKLGVPLTFKDELVVTLYRDSQRVWARYHADVENVEMMPAYILMNRHNTSKGCQIEEELKYMLADKIRCMMKNSFKTMPMETQDVITNKIIDTVFEPYVQAGAEMAERMLGYEKANTI